MFDEEWGYIKKVVAVQNYDWNPYFPHPFIFQILTDSTDTSYLNDPDNYRFYTIEKGEPGIIMGDFKDNHLVKKSNSRDTVGGLGATAITYLDGFVYVGGSHVRNLASSKAAAGYDEYQYYSSYIMKVSADLSTVSWSYSQE